MDFAPQKTLADTESFLFPFQVFVHYKIKIKCLQIEIIVLSIVNLTSNDSSDITMRAMWGNHR